MPTSADVLRAARAYVDTPFHHQGRVRGVGVDCAGLIIGVARELGLSRFDFTAYGHLPHAATLERLCDENLVPVELDRRQAADILLMAFDAEPQHLAFYFGATIIHSFAQVRRAVEQPFDAVWLARTRQVYRFPGLV